MQAIAWLVWEFLVFPIPMWEIVDAVKYFANALNLHIM